MTPSLLTQGLIAFQDSTIASIISVPDVMQTTTVINAREQDPIALYLGAGGDVLPDLLFAEPRDRPDGTRRAIPHGAARELGPLRLITSSRP